MSAPETKRRALGRGLDALLPPLSPSPPAAGSNYAERSVFSCPVEKIVAQKGQPRQRFDTQKLDELAQSIREHGLIEPLVVRRMPGGDKFELIAGERRWRALQRAGLHEALVVVKDVSPEDAFELALIENVQREDLNAIELAEAYERLLRDHGYTQEALADRVGKDRTTISNVLRLLKLPPKVRAKVVSAELSEGHARAILGASDAAAMELLADKVVRGALSVRATEALVRTQAKPAGTTKDKAKSVSVRDLEMRLTRALGTKVEVRDSGNKGEVAIHYSDLDGLDRLLDKLL
ncbi:MAG TPA: ParB/RepB/Spo0J family partition protein [Polyangiaceae bacterium]|jgi:ParB family chromosome partitioning protein|nr:ParB/RepB/Spo0J family partition protein [Polyangiaceae bacterium]